MSSLLTQYNWALPFTTLFGIVFAEKSKSKIQREKIVKFHKILLIYYLKFHLKFKD